MRVAAALALVTACSGSRVYYPLERDRYRVGDQSEMVVTIDSTGTIDGTAFHEHRHSRRRNEIVAMQGDRITQIRVEMLEHESVVDGTAQPAVLGTFLVAAHGDSVDVSKPDGTAPTEHERAFVRAISEQTFRGPLRARGDAFEIGKAHRLASEEAMAFGLGSGGTAELTLTAVTDDEFVVQLVGSEPPTGSGPSSKLTRNWSGQIRISRRTPHSEHWHMEVSLVGDHGVVGHSSQDLEYRLSRHD